MAIQIFDFKDESKRLRKKNVYFQYKEEETFTGEYWVDGKKIYSRYIESTVGSIQDEINAGVSTLLEVHGFAYSMWGQYWPIPCYHQETDYIITAYWGAGLNGVILGFGSNFPGSNRAIAWIKYTKTTD